MCSFLHQTSNALTHTPSFRRKNTDLQTHHLERGCPSMIETCNNQKVSRVASSTLERYGPQEVGSLVWDPVSANFCRCFSASDFAGPLGFTKPGPKRSDGGPCQLTSSPNPIKVAHSESLPIILKSETSHWNVPSVHSQTEVFHFREGIIIQTFQAPGNILLRTPA